MTPKFPENAKIQLTNTGKDRFQIRLEKTTVDFEIKSLTPKQTSVTINGEKLEWDASEQPKSVIQKIEKVLTGRKFSGFSLLPSAHANPEIPYNWSTIVLSWILWAMPTKLSSTMICSDYKAAVEECEKPTGTLRPIAIHGAIRDITVRFDEQLFDFIAEAAGRRAYKVNCEETENKMKICLKKYFEQRPKFFMAKVAQDYLGLTVTPSKELPQIGR